MSDFGDLGVIDGGRPVVMDRDPMTISMREPDFLGDNSYWFRMVRAYETKAAASSGIDSYTALRRRIMEHIHLNSLLSAPLHPSSVNRRFNRAAKALGVTVPAVLADLQGMGHLMTIDADGRSGLFSASQYKERIELMTADGMPTGRLTEILLNGLK